jgi:hypothetical protein
MFYISIYSLFRHTCTSICASTCNFLEFLKFVNCLIFYSLFNILHNKRKQGTKYTFQISRKKAKCVCLLNVLSTSLRRSTILQYIDIVDLPIDRNKNMWLGEREDFDHVCELSTISFYPFISILLVKKNMDVFEHERQFNITQRHKLE